MQCYKEENRAPGPSHVNFYGLVEQDTGGSKGSNMNRAELKEQIPPSQRKNTDKKGFTAKPMDLRKLSIYL